MQLSIYSIPENYIYFYHTDTLLFIPTYVESISDSIQANFNKQEILTRSAPVQVYASSGPRQLSFKLELHRDLMSDLNRNNTKRDIETGEDEVDVLIRQIRGAVMPVYDSTQMLVNPPKVAVRMSSDIFITGIVSKVSIDYKLPIIPGRHSNGTADNSKDRYAFATINFDVTEIDPYDAETVMKYGGNMKMISTSLDDRITDGFNLRNNVKNNKSIYDTVNTTKSDDGENDALRNFLNKIKSSKVRTTLSIK